MKKWFFSDNGKVHGPLDLNSSKEFLAKNPNVYGWHPSFTQWKPVSCISEFADIVPATEQVLLVPKELSEKFLAKKTRLQSKLTSIEDSINHTQTTLNKFDKQVNDYKSLTKNLNDDVKSAIDNIEKKYGSLAKKLAQIKNAVDIAEVEIDDVIKSFDQRVNSNDVFMPACNKSEAKQDNVTSIAGKEASVSSKAKLAETKLATPHERVKPQSAAKQEPTKKAKVQKETAKPAQKSATNDTKDINKTAADGFNGMKNMMKSVFKGDKQVKAAKPVQENEQSTDKPLSMAERLKLAQNNG